MTLLEFLQAGRVDEFNAKRGQRVQLDLFAADLAGLSLAGVDLSNANLEKADLSGCDLTDANLSRANLCGADLTGAKLEHCVLIRARLREAYLGQAVLARAELAGADLSEADLSDADLTDARLASARLREAVLANATLKGADLAEARLSEADLRGADLTGASLPQADLSRANATGARFEKADMRGARCAGLVAKSARFTSADLTGADLTGADLTGADMTDANLERADLFEVIADPGTLAAAKLPAGFGEEVSAGDEGVEIHFDDPSVAVGDGAVGVLWENDEGDEQIRLRAATCRFGGRFAGATQALPIPIDLLQARAIVPLRERFACVVFVDRPAGLEMVVTDLDKDGNPGATRSVRLGYVPVVRPVVAPDDDALLVYGIGRHGALTVHRLEAEGLVELMRAPAHTYRGFCGRLDPVLLGKGGTVAAVRRDGIGRLQTAPPGYPGRLTAAACRPDAELVAAAWVVRGEKGLRFQVLGADAEATRIDAAIDIGAIDLAAVDDRWLLVWTREAERATAMAAWLPGGKPFPLHADDVQDLRLCTRSGGPPAVAMVTLEEELIVAEIAADTANVLARFESA
ncbi:MAG: pentapeptide repeat-containing protein [Myxococcota bacterium]